MVGAQRTAAGRRLGYEARRAAAEGTEVVLVQPVADDLVVMGRNLMSGRRRNEVMETAERTVAEQLRQPETAQALRGPARGRAAQAAPPGRPAVELAADRSRRGRAAED